MKTSSPIEHDNSVNNNNNNNNLSESIINNSNAMSKLTQTIKSDTLSHQPYDDNKKNDLISLIIKDSLASASHPTMKTQTQITFNTLDDISNSTIPILLKTESLAAIPIFSTENRRYTSKTLNRGRIVFNCRYCIAQNKLYNSEPVVPFPLAQGVKTESSKSVSNITNNVSKPLSSHHNEEKIKQLEEEKRMKKYNTNFMKKIDKAILYFNTKKYEESYNELFNSNVIVNETEFAEMLLVISGFDKYIIGEFLSKDKGLNTNFTILQKFFAKIDFRGVAFLESMRFVFKRTNLPKDAGLILIIIDEFTKAYYADNNPSDQFKDSNALYILSSTILALNTMITRTDIKNLIQIKQNDFINMNKDCERNFLIQIYTDLKQQKIELNVDYNEVIYRRYIVQENDLHQTTNATNVNYFGGGGGGTTHNLPTSVKKIQQVSNEEAQKYLPMLYQGERFLKYGNYTTPHERFFKLSPDHKKITWSTISGCRTFHRNKCIFIDSIKDIYIGVDSSRVFQQFRIPVDYDQNCFSIVTTSRSLDLRNENEAISMKWFSAIKYLIKQTKAKNAMKQFTTHTNYTTNNNNTLIYIWTEEIFDNWQHYREFIRDNKDKRVSANTPQTAVNINNNNQQTKHLSLMKNTKHFNEEQFFDLWYVGLPEPFRMALWSIVIGNHLYITFGLYEELCKGIIHQHNFDFEEVNTRILSYISLKKQNIQNRKKPQISESTLINDMLYHIVKLANKAQIQKLLTQCKTKIDKFINDIFILVKAFLSYRKDIIYSKQITYFITMFYLNSENTFQAFCNCVNFLIPSIFMKYLKRDKKYEENVNRFFDGVVKTHLPKLAEHFHKMEINASFYLNYWIEYAFIKSVNYNTLLRLWDVYLVNGEVFWFEVALAVMKMVENDLYSLPVVGVVSYLKKIKSEKYSEEDLFEKLKGVDLTECYRKEKMEMEIGEEKGMLFMKLMDNDI